MDSQTARLRFVHVVMATLAAAAIVVTFWFVTRIPHRRAYERAQRQLMLHKLGRAIMSCEAALQRPPDSPEDLGPFPKDHPDLRRALDAGEIILRLESLAGNPGEPRSEIVLAYEKQVPGTGGYVLMADGAFREMTSEEFRLQVQIERTKSVSN